jgi:hypothetical protein
MKQLREQLISRIFDCLEPKDMDPICFEELRAGAKMMARAVLTHGGENRKNLSPESRIKVQVFMNNQPKMKILQELCREMITLLQQYEIIYCLSSKDLFPLLIANFYSRFEAISFSDEFVKEIMDLIFLKYKEIMLSEPGKYAQKLTTSMPT